MSHVFATMGTVASLDVRGRELPPAIARELELLFERIEQVFSLYRDASELSRIANKSLALTRSSEQLRDVYAQAVEWQYQTDEAFTPHRPDGVIDLDGIVKALAIQRGGELLTANGFRDWSLNVGGDILVSGRPDANNPWAMGVIDPADRSAMLFGVELGGTRRAIATSGTSERGEHVWRAGPEGLKQVTVVAGDIVTADVLATAILAGGEATLELATREWTIDVCTVGADGEIKVTPGMRSLVRSPAVGSLHAIA